jgi:hypothetical protein
MEVAGIADGSQCIDLGVCPAFSGFGWSELAVAAASLLLGAAAHGAALYFGGDRTFRSLLELVRLYAAHGPGFSSDRSSKAPRVRKTD